MIILIGSAMVAGGILGNLWYRRKKYNDTLMNAALTYLQGEFESYPCESCGAPPPYTEEWLIAEGTRICPECKAWCAECGVGESVQDKEPFYALDDSDLFLCFNCFDTLQRKGDMQ